MKGSPRSLWLSAANRATGYWTSAAVAVTPTAAARYAGGIREDGHRKQAQAEARSAELGTMTLRARPGKG